MTDSGTGPDPGAEIQVTPEMIAGSIDRAAQEFFWEWRAENAEAVVHQEARPDAASLFAGLHRIYVGVPVCIGESG